MLFWYLFLSLGIILPAIFWSWNAWITYQNRHIGKKHCEKNDLRFLKAKRYEKHIRPYVEKDGKSCWSNYEVDRHNQLSWLGKSPLEKLEEK